MTTPIGDTRDGVASRLRRLVIGTFLLLVLVGISGVAAIEIATNQNSKLTAGYSPAESAHQQTLTLMLDSETAVRGYLLTGNQSFLAPYRTARRQILPDLDRTKAALDGAGIRNLDAAINAERSLASRWLTGYADPIGANPNSSTLPSAGQQGAAKAVFDQYRSANALVTNELEQTRTRLRADVSRLHSLAIPLLAAATVAALLVAAVLAYRAAAGISRPLRALRSVVGRLDRGDLGAHANEQDGPSEVRALARAVNSVGRRARAEAAADRDAEQFRQRTRLISSTIRRSSNATQMAEHLVRGLGDAFEVDRAWLFVFAGERVPQLLAQWQREPLRPLAPPLDYQVTELHALAQRLWDNAHTIGIDDHRTYEPTEAGRVLFGLAQAVGASASLVVPIGDSAGPLGLIWLAMAGHSRHWTLTETGVAQFLASDLAHSMTQSHLIQTQAEAVRLLQELDQAKADFISTVSHELRTPLTSITGYLEMLQDGDAGRLPRQAHEMLTVIDRNAVRLRNLIEDLLTQTRIDAGRLRLELASVDVAAVLGSVHQAMLPQASSDGVQLKLIAPAGCKIEADQQQLEQVFMNLVGNACKFTPAGGEITVELIPDCEEGVLVEVS
ncbi:MAG TPA: histidine kinase dimerization/phospho-acceptor domain-containing protein, partial [Jatrophihabitans sp.]|nr:histidine kinase dimerization/phospho-acceptor domain-containing protein [Jatrophihabitans sp.]